MADIQINQIQRLDTSVLNNDIFVMERHDGTRYETWSVTASQLGSALGGSGGSVTIGGGGSGGGSSIPDYANEIEIRTTANKTTSFTLPCDCRVFSDLDYNFHSSLFRLNGKGVRPVQLTPVYSGWKISSSSTVTGLDQTVNGAYIDIPAYTPISYELKQAGLRNYWYVPFWNGNFDPSQTHTIAGVPKTLIATLNTTAPGGYSFKGTLDGVTETITESAYDKKYDAISFQLSALSGKKYAMVEYYVDGACVARKSCGIGRGCTISWRASVPNSGPAQASFNDLDGILVVRYVSFSITTAS